MTVWFTVKLEDRPGSLARVATALGERGVNITGIVGVAEDTDGALMLTTSDADATRSAFAALGAALRGARPDGRRLARPVDRCRPRRRASGRGRLTGPTGTRTHATHHRRRPGHGRHPARPR